MRSKKKQGKKSNVGSDGITQPDNKELKGRTPASAKKQSKQQGKQNNEGLPIDWAAVRTATDAVQNATDSLGRAIVVQDEMTSLIEELRIKLAETEKGLLRKNAEIVRLQGEVDEALACKEKLTTKIERHKAKFGWGKSMPQDLVLRILNRAGGRGQRLMVAACREFEALVEVGRSSDSFAREPRLLVIGGMDGASHSSPFFLH